MVPFASILVVNYNSGPHLQTCLDSLKAQTVAEFEVFILDNGSNDDSIDLASKVVGADTRFHFLHETQNFGFAEGNNRAAQHARAEWIVTLNPDAFPEPDWLEHLVAATNDHPQTTMFGSMQLDHANPLVLDGAGDRYLAAGIPWRDRSWRRFDESTRAGATAYEVFSPCAAAAMYRLDVFREVGGFDPQFFCYVEDVDLGFRLRRRGHHCLQLTDARVRHVGGGSNSSSPPGFVRYHGLRNLIWCFSKNMPVFLLVLLLPLLALILLFVLAKSLIHGDSPTTVRALRDGLSQLPRLLKERQKAPDLDSFKSKTLVHAFDISPLDYLRSRYGWRLYQSNTTPNMPGTLRTK